MDSADVFFKVVFSIDLCLRFFITYDHFGKRVSSVREIALNYVKGDLLIDVLTIIPLMRLVAPELLLVEKVLDVVNSDMMKGNT